MGLSRRPARFKRPDFMETKEITPTQLKSLRAAAARVFVDERNLKEKSSEMNIVADGSTDKKENVASFDNGVQNLSTAPIKIEPKGTKSNN
ncbi:hypothetical protein MtrunA17_Chr3g0125851 [Medicago truncatula]|uniref:Uncharacterized protein n=1 Tax=Medicago truncatula TaxID=3880 RepID=A0A072V239_MEDTR|nr:hypothetical protein MTR_3g089115 [Medicago truncatula]RHN69543.1 hypothetical protein MtrunA17_Chr3g0125851 [Medicago truncatula]